MKHSKWYRFGFVVFCLLAAAKLTALVIVVYEIIAHLCGILAGDAVSSATIIALLVDFVALIAMWAINKGLRIYRKATSVCSLIAPVFLLAVLVFSVVMVGYDPADQSAQVLSVVCWCLMALYLLIPDVLIGLDFAALRHGFPQTDSHADSVKEPTLSERIRSAKK